MDCLKCSSKACKTEKKDCTGGREETIRGYRDAGLSATFGNADALVAHGRAGTLSRIEEIVEYCTLQGYKKIALAYCYSMEDLAAKVSSFFRGRDFNVLSYRCTIQGIQEKEINNDLGESVACNPAGQAETINRENAEFVIEMGLCLGHDVIFHRYLEKPFTVFAVKDRLLDNCPHNFFKTD